MKWMLAAILSAVMVAPAFAAVDITLTAADGTNLITIPAPGSAQIVLNLGLSKPTGSGAAAAVSAYNAALRLNKVAGGASGKFTITGRAGNANITDVKWVSTGTDPDTGDDIDLAIGSVLAPNSVDVGIYKGSGFWGNTKWPSVTNAFTLDLTGLQAGDIYQVTIGDPGAGIVVADGVSPTPNKIPISSLGAVKVIVMPEPASLLLLAIGGLFLRRRHA